MLYGDHLNLMFYETKILNQDMQKYVKKLIHKKNLT